MVNGDTLRSTARRYWQRSLRGLGWPGLLGALLLIVAAAILAVAPTLRHAVVELQFEVAHRREGLRRPQAPAPEPMTAQERLDRYVDGFPPISQNASDLQAVFAGAKRAQVALPKGDYSVKADAGSPFVTYTATFPVHESYAALKMFAADVLQALPHAALDELRMVRPDATGTVLDGTVRFTFIYRRP
jgi:hypothetical protein